MLSMISRRRTDVERTDNEIAVERVSHELYESGEQGQDGTRAEASVKGMIGPVRRFEEGSPDLGTGRAPDNFPDVPAPYSQCLACEGTGWHLGDEMTGEACVVCGGDGQSGADS
jgi:hypothetical protein